MVHLRSLLLPGFAALLAGCLSVPAENPTPEPTPQPTPEPTPAVVDVAGEVPEQPATGAVRRPVSRRARLLASLFGTLGALLLAEIGVRVAGLEDRWMPSLLFEMSSDVAVHRYAADPRLVYELAPGATARLPRAEPWGDDPRAVRVNGLGLRGGERSASKAPGVLRIVCLGGSNTYGAAVSDGRTWPDALERELAHRLDRPVEVWNAGVSGWMTPQKVLRAQQAIEGWEPDLLLFQLFNTGPRNLFVPGGAPDWRRQLDRDPTLWSDLLRWAPSNPGILFRSSALVRMFLIAANRVDRDGLEPGARVEALEVAARERGRERYRALRASTNVPMALVVVPAGGHAEWWDEGRDGPALDLRALPRPDLPGVDSIHPGAAAYAWYGRELATLLIYEGLVE